MNQFDTPVMLKPKHTLKMPVYLLAIPLAVAGNAVSVAAESAGHSVSITLGPSFIDQGKDGDTKNQIAYASLSKDGKDHPENKECGKDIDWNWSITGLAYTTGNNDLHAVPSDELGQWASAANTGNDPRIAAIIYPLQAKAQRYQKWAVSFKAIASQGKTECHPDGWSATGKGEDSFYDISLPPLTTVPTIPPGPQIPMDPPPGITPTPPSTPPAIVPVTPPLA
jgi:hypothetical protein